MLVDSLFKLKLSTVTLVQEQQSPQSTLSEATLMCRGCEAESQPHLIVATRTNRDQSCHELRGELSCHC
eukprot:m.64662 g.64662  ORF g.64662 m.64662 type:complete len:69 (-) comp17899_c0_seq1:8-214(-)